MNDNPRPTREWLLSRHAKASPALDQARAAAIRAVARPANNRSVIGATLHAIFYPNRFAWGTLAAIWASILVFYSTIGHPAPSPSGTKIPPAAIAGWINQFKAHDTFASIDRLD